MGYRLNIAVPTVLGAISLSACATLPSSGPTGSQIQRSIERSDATSSIKLIELRDVSMLPASPVAPLAVLQNLTPPPTDMVGPGDVLDIAIYESGVTLFGGSKPSADSGTGTFDTTSKAERLLANRVDDNGDIQVPYAGRLHVAGLTIGQVESKIRKALRGYSQNPQILVTMRETITNSIIVAGEVMKPGRLVLPTNRETVSDVVALAGGYRGEAKDLTVRLQRGALTEEFRLNDAVASDQGAIRLYPGDRLSVMRAPRTFSVMGAPAKAELFSFGAAKVSLAEALAQAGGSSAGFGDPKAVFIFRYVVNQDGVAEPVVYHFNMMEVGEYFLAQRFMMQDKDVLYIGNARANQPSKLIQLVSQLFSPLVTATSAAQALR